LVRRSTGALDEVLWDPPEVGPDLSALQNVEGIIHLAGEPISALRWTETKKRAIEESRVRGTELLVRTFKRVATPPKVLLVASAIGFYGNRGEAFLSEKSAAGTGFLSRVCQKWEAASEPVTEIGTRRAVMRFGIVLSPKGGALRVMQRPFSLGLGGRVGHGQQYMSWITLDDLLRAMAFLLETNTLQGPVNFVAPEPVTNADFTKALGRALHRPTFLPLPAVVARAALGEMAEALLLSSTRVRPEILTSAGFTFRYPELGPALTHLLSDGS